MTTSSKTGMTHAIIGAGNVGVALARHFARRGLRVGLANSRPPDAMADTARELGSDVVPMTVQQAAQADIVILAVPFRAHRAVAGARADWSGCIVVDAMNTYGVAPEVLKGRPSTEIVAEAFPGARVVKTFNQLPARLLASPPDEDGGRRVMFVSSDDAQALDSVASLVDALGFAPIALGRLAEGGALIGLGGPLILQNLIKHG